MGPFLAAHDEPRGMPPITRGSCSRSSVRRRHRGDQLAPDRGAPRRRHQLRHVPRRAGRLDHKTIAEFRRRHLAAFEGLFLDALPPCHAAGLRKLGRVAIDGTKLKANASRHKAMSYGRMAEREAALAAEVQAILDEAEAVDAAEDAQFGDARGDELPPELRRRETRLARIREAPLSRPRPADRRSRRRPGGQGPAQLHRSRVTDHALEAGRLDLRLQHPDRGRRRPPGHRRHDPLRRRDRHGRPARPRRPDRDATRLGARRSSSPMPAMRRTTTSPIPPSAASTPTSRPAATATARRLRSPRGLGSRPVSRVASGWLASSRRSGVGPSIVGARRSSSWSSARPRRPAAFDGSACGAGSR